MIDENKLLLAGIQDKYENFLDYYALVSTDFMSLPQQSVCSQFLRQMPGVRGWLYGGYEDAERRMLIFMPDYIDVNNEAELMEYFAENPDECPLVILSLTYKAGAGAKELGHRDYLGSILGEGIKREKIGDILVRPGGAQVIAERNIAEYLALHYGKAGRTTLEAEILPISQVDSGIVKKEEMRTSVASPRLDNVVSAVFNVSRKDAVTAINQGRVFVNDIENNKPDYTLKDGEKLVLRGKGKAIYKGTSGTSKKGKTYITVEKYV